MHRAISGAKSWSCAPVAQLVQSGHSLLVTPAGLAGVAKSGLSYTPEALGSLNAEYPSRLLTTRGLALAALRSTRHTLVTATSAPPSSNCARPGTGSASGFVAASHSCYYWILLAGGPRPWRPSMRHRSGITSPRLTLGSFFTSASYRNRTPPNSRRPRSFAWSRAATANSYCSCSFLILPSVTFDTGPARLGHQKD